MPRGSLSAASSISDVNEEIEEVQKIKQPFVPGVDPDPVRQDFALKSFNLKERSFADRSRRELPRGLLEQFKKE